MRGVTAATTTTTTTTTTIIPANTTTAIVPASTATTGEFAIIVAAFLCTEIGSVLGIVFKVTPFRRVGGSDPLILVGQAIRRRLSGVVGKGRLIPSTRDIPITRVIPFGGVDAVSRRRRSWKQWGSTLIRGGGGGGVGGGVRGERGLG